MAKKPRSKKSDSKAEANGDASPKASSSSARELEPFKGDANNGPGVRCKRTGVVIPDGPEFEERKAAHLASLAG